MDSRIVISFGRNEVFDLFAIWRNHRNISLSLSHVVSASPSCIYTKLCYIVHNVIGGLSTFMGLLSYDSPLPALLKSLFWIVCRHFQTALLEITLSGLVLRTEASGTERTDSNTAFGLPELPTSFAHPTPHTPPPAGSSPQVATLRPWSRAPCQSANINLSLGKTKKQKCQMPLARGAGTLTNDHSRKKRRELETVDGRSGGFEFVVTLSSDWVLPSPPSPLAPAPRPLTSSPLELGWKSLHQKSSQSLSLLPGVDAITLKT